MARAALPVDDPEGAAIHARLLRGDASAFSACFHAYYPDLVRRLLAKYPRLRDPQMAEEAATSAVNSYLVRPDQYDPTRKALGPFLYMAALGDLKNLLQSESRRRAHLVRLEDVALRDQPRNDPVEDAMNRIDEAQRVVALRARADAIKTDPAERRVLELMASGERRTAPYAQAIGLGHLPPAEQRREVKRYKDRLKKRASRAAGSR